MKILTHLPICKSSRSFLHIIKVQVHLSFKKQVCCPAARPPKTQNASCCLLTRQTCMICGHRSIGSFPVFLKLYVTWLVKQLGSGFSEIHTACIKITFASPNLSSIWSLYQSSFCDGFTASGGQSEIRP